MTQDHPLHLSELIAQAAPLTSAMEVREYSDTSWVFAVTDDVFVSVDHDEERDVLVLTANIGKPPGSNAIEVYELLLQMATQWRDTGGLRMGLDRPDGFVTQIYDLPRADLRADRFAAALENFAQVADAWRGILKSTETQEAFDATYIRI